MHKGGSLQPAFEPLCRRTEAHQQCAAEGARQPAEPGPNPRPRILHQSMQKMCPLCFSVPAERNFYRLYSVSLQWPFWIVVCE